MKKEKQITSSTNFLITIHHHENHSWQGVIQWLDTGKTVHFRSALELMNLMQDAVQAQNQLEDSLRSWNDGKLFNVK